MATTEPHLIVIGNLQVSCVRKESPETLRDKNKGQKDVTKLTEAATFLAGWELGTLQRVSQPRPGDVYHRPHTVKQPRPLGLLPDRGAKLDTMKVLTKILSPAPPASAPAIAFHRDKTAEERIESTQNAQPNSVVQDIEGTKQNDVKRHEGLISAKKELSHDLVLESNITKELMSVEGKVNANLRHLSLPEDDAYLEHEAKVLRGMMEYLLPQVGPHVHTLDLAHGKAVSNEVVFRMLRQCPNLRYLDLSHTGVSDFAFRGLLGRHHNFWRLEYVDLTGCVLVTDIAIQRIAQALGSLQHPLLSPLGCCRGGGGRTAMRVVGGGGGMTGEIDRGSKGGGRRKMEEAKEPQLKYLILSGCHLVTDVGLRSLVAGGGLPNLQYLDLSGLCSVTERGLNDLVSACPSLVPELLFYCDNILAGPYAECANGCQNVGSPGLCCRQLI